MEQNLILAGVGGQGILTIARAMSIAALRRGLQIRQAEVHGMAQRGGAVQSHLRIADHELFSDLVPSGAADMIIAVEPLESLRYVQYLREGGVVITSTNSFVNIDNYPPIEQVLERIASHPRHIFLDADRLARAAGSARAANIVVLGAASLFSIIESRDLEDAVAEMFSAKGANVIEVNRRAFRFGRNAAAAYRSGLERGGTSLAVRQWIETLPAECLAAEEQPDAPPLEVMVTENRLSDAEAHAVERTLLRVYEQGRKQLYEHEVYTLLELIGAISPPRYAFVPKGHMMSEEALNQYPGARVVLKIVSPDVAHKTEAHGIAFVHRDYQTVSREIERLVARHAENAQVEGVLVVEYVERTQPGFGNELFVGVRATREFGPVIAAGLGGVDTEYFASKMRPGVAVAKALAKDTSAEDFLDLFKATAAYDVLSGHARGHERIVSDGELLRCFQAFISIARRFCVDRGVTGPDVAELEVNPFAFRQQRMIPLDGRGRLGTACKQPAARPLGKVRNLLEPQAIAVLGVSSKAMNFGRIILNNVKNCGFPKEHLYVVKENSDLIDAVRCVPSIAALPEPVDLLVIAAAAAQLPEVIAEVVNSGQVQAAILIPGGVGETEGSEEIEALVHQAIRTGRARPDGGPVFLGPNSMGLQSRPGRYDTFFIPANKLDNRWAAPARRVAFLSQSGAFIISRLSNIEMLDPAIAVSIGNQLDLTIADLLQAVAARDDIDAIAVYAEGFNDYDGLAFVRAVERATAAGKRVVFYKAGRTAPGRSAAAGHTASVAGDYDVCQAAALNAGALVAETFKEFEQLIELATALHDKEVGGRRIAAISNAGFETVGMADNIHGPRCSVEIPALSDGLRDQLLGVLERHKLAGLVNARNPLDLTPMSSEQVYEDCLRVLLDSDEVDAAIVALVPLTPALLTTPAEIDQPGSLVERLPRVFAESKKPLIVVIDSGSHYDPLARALRSQGVPVFRTCDQAIRSFGEYLCHRTRGATIRTASADARAIGTAPPANPAEKVPAKSAKG
ncbi:MAG: indolepyruvate oxidoreductase subunit beta [Planctomycetes bacterium]|nr:indolepyruvate oxidoreductase subunit beta [Planctomycetota bacterium]